MRDDRRAEWSGAPEPPLVGRGRPLSRRDVHSALESSGRNHLLESEIHSRRQEAHGTRRRDPRGRAPGGCSRGPARLIGAPAVVAVRLAAPSRGPRRHGLSKSVAKAPIEPKHRKRIVGIPCFLPWSAPVRSAFATDSDTPPLQTVPGSPPAPPRAHPSPSPHRFGPTDPPLPVRKAQPLPAKHRLSRFRWSPGRFRRLFEPTSLTAHLIPVVVEVNLAAWRRLLRPSASATPLHPSLYEKKERSKGRRSVVVGKERSRGGGTRWWVVENGIVAM